MRRKNDAYYTGRKAVDALLSRIHIYGSIIEPCYGKGHISNPLKEAGYEVIERDITEGFDARLSWKIEQGITWAITNPPFNYAYDILQRAIEKKLRVAFLLRLSFLEPTYERQEFLNSNPPTKLIILPRYSFTEDGKTDSVTCAWMLWNYKDDKPIEVARKR